jgi:pimeloyl-ACP methyl ester carboxylesterase
MALGLVRDGLTEPGLYDGSLPRMYAQTGPRRFLQTMGEMRRDHPVLQARAVSAPCLIVRGTRDTAAPEPAVRALAAALPHGSYQAIEGSPHAVQYAAPEAFTRLAVAFCARVEDKGRISCRIHSDTGIRAGSFGTTSNRLRIDGHPVHYEMVSAAPLLGGDSGQNTLLPLLLLHGLAGSGEVWERFLPLLDQSLLPRAVYVPDLPGFGRSGGTRRTLGIHELADWCARFLDAVQVERADVAAHSMGCQVALALARRHPERVGRLVLVGPTTGSRSVPAWRYLTGMAVGSSREPLLYRFLAARMFWRMGIRRYVETVREMMRDDALAGASGVTAESLVIWGDRDTIVPESAARSLAKTLPGGSYQVVAKAAHVVPFNSAGAFAPLAHAFWQQQRKSD